MEEKAISHYLALSSRSSMSSSSSMWRSVLIHIGRVRSSFPHQNVDPDKSTKRVKIDQIRQIDRQTVWVRISIKSGCSAGPISFIIFNPLTLPSSFSLTLYAPLSVTVCLSVYLSVFYVSVYLSVFLCVCLLVCVSVRLSICLGLFLSIYLVLTRTQKHPLSLLHSTMRKVAFQ